MRKLIGIVVASMMFVNIGYAEMTLIEEKTIKGKKFSNVVSTVCIDGYKFVYMRTGLRHRAQSIVQFFEERDGKSLPAKC